MKIKSAHVLTRIGYPDQVTLTAEALPCPFDQSDPHLVLSFSTPRGKGVQYVRENIQTPEIIVTDVESGVRDVVDVIET